MKGGFKAKDDLRKFGVAGRLMRVSALNFDPVEWPVSVFWRKKVKNCPFVFEDLAGF
jgi:hypothetical protein